MRKVDGIYPQTRGEHLDSNTIIYILRLPNVHGYSLLGQLYLFPEVVV